MQKKVHVYSCTAEVVAKRFVYHIPTEGARKSNDARYELVKRAYERELITVSRAAENLQPPHEAMHYPIDDHTARSGDLN